MHDEEGEEIFSAICDCMSEIGAVGKGQATKDAQGKLRYKFRGIDDVMNALQPAMIKSKVFCVPTILEEKREERTTKNGGLIFYVRMTIKYRFYTTDGSYIETIVIGESMDSGDKACNKCMSIAFKYACFQIFCIPTEEQTKNDPDREVHELKKEGPQEEIKTIPVPETIGQIKAQVLEKTIKNKGQDVKKIKSWGKVKRLEDFTLSQFKKTMDGLEKLPDIKLPESKQLDLGL